MSRLRAAGASMMVSTTSDSGMPCAFAWSVICLSTNGVRT